MLQSGTTPDEPGKRTPGHLAQTADGGARGWHGMGTESPLAFIEKTILSPLS